MPVKYDLDIIYCPKKHPLVKEKALKRSALNIKGNLFIMILDEATPKFVVKKSYSSTSTISCEPEH